MNDGSARRPSPAMVVAMLALFVAISGTAIALPGKDGVNSGDVKDESLKSQDLRDGQAVQASDVIDESLGSADLEDGAAVASADVVDDSLQSEDINDGGLESADLDTDSVASIDILNGTVGFADIAASSVNSAKIVDSSIASSDIFDGGVASADIGSDAVGGDELGDITVAFDATPHDFGDQDEGNNDYAYGSSQADCPGTSIVIGGGAEWLGAGRGGAEGDELQAITESNPGAGASWKAIAVSDVDNQDFRAFALCLSPGE